MGTSSYSTANPNGKRTIALRQATSADMDWLYHSFKQTMQDFIEKTWGWDELLQAHSFFDNLPAKSFTIASLDQIAVGALNLREKGDHLWLEMVLVLPEYQGQGIGRTLLEYAQTKAESTQKPLRLSVLKLNPAQHFYRHMGFEDTALDQWSIKMQWLGH